MVWAAIAAGQRPVWYIIKPATEEMRKKKIKKTVNAAVYRAEILEPFIKYLQDNELYGQIFMQVFGKIYSHSSTIILVRGSLITIILTSPSGWGYAPYRASKYDFIGRFFWHREFN